MNIILDMDETLLSSQCCYESALFSGAFALNDDNKIILQTNYIHERPFLDTFFQYIFHKFERVSIWTHGTTDWYNTCYNHILWKFIPPGKSFYKVITRDNGILPFEADCSKPLHKFYKLCHYHNEKNTFILDDKPHTYKFNVANSIPIKPYYLSSMWGEKNLNDSELLRIIHYLEKNLFCN